MLQAASTGLFNPLASKAHNSDQCQIYYFLYYKLNKQVKLKRVPELW